MTVTEHFTDNDGVRIHWLDSAAAEPSATDGLPILFSPGFSDRAVDYLQVVGFMLPRRVVVVDVRGRGGSDAPVEADYSAAAQASDLRAVVEEAGLGRFHLMTFSRGTSSALEMAFGMPDRIASISIGDYWPREMGLEDAMADRMLSLTFRGDPVGARVPEHVVRAIFRQSRERDLGTQLAAMPCPVMLAVGTEEGRLVTDEDVERFRAERPDLDVVTIDGAAHDLFRRDRFAYPRAVQAFIAERCPGT